MLNIVLLPPRRKKKLTPEPVYIVYLEAQSFLWMHCKPVFKYSHSYYGFLLTSLYNSQILSLTHTTIFMIMKTADLF